MTLRTPIILLSLLLAVAPALAQEQIVVSGVGDSAETTAARAVIGEAYRRVGLELVFRSFSGPDALIASNSGEVDAELQRIDGVTRSFSNLIQVPIPINYLQGAAFSKKYEIPIRGWTSLEPYTIGIVRGILFAEEGTQGMDVRVAGSYGGLARLLEDEEVDVAIMSQINGRYFFNGSEEVEEMEGILEILFMYHYVHKKNKHLVAPLGAELKAMLLDGTTRRLRDDAYELLLTRGRGSNP